ncbi:DUF6624 domain-containing protein [Echinicola vietnamensis]|uniref:Uncharacterized protein n=1 Tax=Echinicola vietnamensis (strain DSM 17526 / LMG 23754 / KMM 6221) TaxID=926556 RepID=L0FRS3_ECHVK|nr:DUF6624 domain-containing protein [Echinicola vietnamensis]AGA76619.1 hypothetical protein Echvi_0328 [Echinicola vietnamensis DSM 17526]
MTLLTILISCKKSDKDNSVENKINLELKANLENILLKDQGIREIVNGSLSEERKAELLTQMNLKESDIDGNKKFDLMRKIDSINILEIESIISKYGYPSKSTVGEPASKAVFYVIQHSDKISKYLPIIRKAAENGDITQTSLAMMEDRNLMEQGLEQIYGTQIKGKANKKGEWIYFLWPIKNADSIDTWRKQVGFKKSLEEYLKDMDVEFKLYQINELNDL